MFCVCQIIKRLAYYDGSVVQNHTVRTGTSMKRHRQSNLIRSLEARSEKLFLDVSLNSSKYTLKRVKTQFCNSVSLLKLDFF